MIDTAKLKRIAARTPSTFLLSLAIMAPLNLGAQEKPKFSKRLDKLQITVTEIERIHAVRSLGEEGKRFEPKPGYFFLKVRVKLRNVNTKRGLREWLTPILRTSVGLEYGPSVRLVGLGPYQPEVFELLPGEETQGIFVFEVKEGALPDRITFTRAFSAEYVNISLKGFAVRDRQEE